MKDLTFGKFNYAIPTTNIEAHDVAQSIGCASFMECYETLFSDLQIGDFRKAYMDLNNQMPELNNLISQLDSQYHNIFLSELMDLGSWFRHQHEKGFLGLIFRP